MDPVGSWLIESNRLARNEYLLYIEADLNGVVLPNHL
jgi:hypothetical protein